ncbi:MAG: DUF2079 domain-containing protein [Elainellaceae cyanobacterium]
MENKHLLVQRKVIQGAIATQPLKLIEEAVSPVDKTLKYLLGHWLPLAFIPAIAPASWTIAGLPLLQILLQQGSTPMSITVRYATARKKSSRLRCN